MTMPEDPQPIIEKPRVEPEIIPPRRGRASYGPTGSTVWVSLDSTQSSQFYTAKLGPFRIAVLLLALGIIGAILFVVLLSAFVVGATAVGLIIAAAMLSGLWHRYWRSRTRRGSIAKVQR